MQVLCACSTSSLLLVCNAVGVSCCNQCMVLFLTVAGRLQSVGLFLTVAGREIAISGAVPHCGW